MHPDEAGCSVPIELRKQQNPTWCTLAPHLWPGQFVPIGTAGLSSFREARAL